MRYHISHANCEINTRRADSSREFARLTRNIKCEVSFSDSTVKNERGIVRCRLQVFRRSSSSKRTRARYSRDVMVRSRKTRTFAFDRYFRISRSDNLRTTATINIRLRGVDGCAIFAPRKSRPSSRGHFLSERPTERWVKFSVLISVYLYWAPYPLIGFTFSSHRFRIE